MNRYKTVTVVAIISTHFLCITLVLINTSTDILQFIDGKCSIGGGELHNHLYLFSLT